MEAQRPVTVSVCLPTARGADVVRRALASILAQDLGDFEVIVGDETGEAEPAVADAADGRIRYYRNAERLGFARNHVALLDRAEGRYVTVQHDDDWWEPTYLSRMAGVLDSDDGVGMACCATVLDRGDTRRPWPFPLTPGRHDDVLPALLREEWFLLINATMWRRQSWTGAARQWPDLRCGDLQLFLSIAEAGWALHFTPEPLAHWVQHDEQSGAWRGSDHGLGVADDVLAFWDGWLSGRPEGYAELAAAQRGRWHLRRARALILAGRPADARAAVRAASALRAGLPGARRLALASRLPTGVVTGAVRLRRALWAPARG